MSNSISSGAPALPTSATTGIGAPATMPVVGGGGTAITGQPLVAGDAEATDAALTPVRSGSVVDAAIAAQLGTDVTGGGAPAPDEDPRNGIPAFVRGYLPSSADEGATLQGPPSKGGAPQQGVQQGWAWTSCGVPAQYPPAMCTPSQVEPAPPGKGEPTPPGDLEPAPPGKGEPPVKGPDGPPVKGETPPMQGPPGKGEPPSKTPPSTPPTKPGAVDKVDDSPRPKRHTVKQGEWLSKIADKFGITWQELYAANKGRIKDPNLIYPGQVLMIPPRKSKPKPPVKPPSKPPTGNMPPAPGKPPVPTKPPTGSLPPVPTKPPVVEPPVVQPPVVEPPVVEPPVVEPPTNMDPDTPPPGGTSDTLPTAPPTPDTDGLPPSLPPGA